MFAGPTRLERPRALRRLAVGRGRRRQAGEHDDSMGWRSWKMGAVQTPENSALNIALRRVGGRRDPGDAAGAARDVRPRSRALLPRLSVRHARRAHGRDERALSRVGRQLHEGRTAPTCRAFTARGGKLIVVHGASDPIFSLHDSIAWWKGVDAAEKGQAAPLHAAVRGARHGALLRRTGDRSVRRVRGARRLGRDRAPRPIASSRRRVRDAVARPHAAALRVSRAGALHGHRQHRGCRRTSSAGETGEVRRAETR